jgi:hypothetical protein
MVIDEITSEFESFKHKHQQLTNNLSKGKNLAELQGVATREKEANQNFGERADELADQMVDTGQIRPETNIK